MSVKKEIIDLVDEMQWEDSEKIEKVTPEQAGLEEENETDNTFTHGIYAYLNWFYDGDHSDISDY